jgi:hypothetical protein
MEWYFGTLPMIERSKTNSKEFVFASKEFIIL